MEKKVSPAKKALWIFLECLGYGASIIFPSVVIFTLCYGIYQFCDIPGRLFLGLIFGKALSGLGFLLIFGLTLILGAFLRSGFAKEKGINEYFLKALKKIPIIGTIIGFIQETTRGIAWLQNVYERKGSVFVLVETFRKGLWQVGAITGILPPPKEGKRKEPLICIFIFNSPLPITGWPIFLTQGEVDELERISASLAMKIVCSGGLSSGGLISEGKLGKVKLKAINKALKKIRKEYELEEHTPAH